MEGIASCGFHFYRSPISVEVQRSNGIRDCWALRIRNDGCSIQLDILLDDDQLDALRVSIGQAQQALADVVIRVAE